MAGPVSDAGPDGAQAVVDAVSVPPAGKDASVADAQLDETTGLSPQNEWGPLARITWMDLPETLEDARRAGCLVFGDDAGSSLHSFIILTGTGLPDMLRAGPTGLIPLVYLMRIQDWSEGAEATDLDEVTLEFITGEQDPERQLYIGDAAQHRGEALNIFSETLVQDGWLDTEGGDYAQPIRVPDGPLFFMPLSYAKINGRLSADGAGFSVSSGNITGYVTAQSISSMLDDIRGLCMMPSTPPLCALLSGQLDRSNEELIETLIELIGGWDVHVSDQGYPRSCSDEEFQCNAIGACLIYEAEGTRVQGVYEGP